MTILVLLLAAIVVIMLIVIASQSTILSKLHSDLEAVEAKAEGAVKSDVAAILADLKKYL